MDVYLLSRNILALKRPGAATRIGSIPLPLFSKRNEPLHSPQTTFFRDLAGLHQTSDANGVGLANAQRNVCALHQNATRHGISIVVSPAAVHVSDRSTSTYRIVRLPHIESFGFHISNRSASTYRIVRRSTIDDNPPPSNAGPPPRRCATHQSLTRSAGAAEAGIRDIRGTRTLIPPSSLRLLAPIDATLRQKPSLLDRFSDTLFCGRPHIRRSQRFINLHNVKISLRNRSPGDDCETSPADRDFLRARQPECAAHPRKRNKEEIRPPIVDRAIVSSFSISFLM